MLDKTKTGLIVIDVQGKLATIMNDSEPLIANLVKLVKVAKLLNLPILWLEQNPEKLGETLPILRDVLKEHQPIPKWSFSACGEPALVDAVKQSHVDTWLVCGIETHVCVYQTSLDLLALGKSVELVSDCVSSRTLANKTLALNKLIRKGADITSLEMCLFELMGDCRTDAFKGALSIIK
ncbi:hydrolase [Marinomonas sp. IMCC 4694]|uniref:hydrolase n=1 Tax=Marinomonas sp. IMCC 4694 TaxID=2605432 RepID=UPI0011E86BB6|nr:hydrolase [Marinomonas sp. IMCC 4694]TYL48340.1 hydrolase [Marinomonas sp. IMCC 4694]